MNYTLTPLYIDMDGTIADFNNEPRALERFRDERGFFFKLKPLMRNIEAVKNAMDKGYPVYIITASPHEKADADKLRWLAKYLPTLDTDRVIIMRLGENKTSHMRTKYGVLFDDYSKNLREWICHDNNRAVKVKQDGDIAEGILALNVLPQLIING